MPRIEENEETFRKTLVEPKVERRCICSERCKLVICISTSIMVMIGFGIIDIYYAYTDRDGSGDSI